MSIRHSLLALLQDRPRYGYQLRVEFEDRTGSSWPLNIGQVYTTLDRLERDGLVRREGDDGAGHVIYSITPSGRAEVGGWFASPTARTNPPRNELAIKLALALTLPTPRSCWCWTHSCSRPKPRSAGWTSARHGSCSWPILRDKPPRPARWDSPP
jgi:DNA-binding PadR family transcriptional regulator